MIQHSRAGVISNALAVCAFERAFAMALMGRPDPVITPTLL